MGEGKIITVSFSSSIKIMNIVLETLEEMLATLGMDVEKHWKVFLALREVVSNGIVHGNRKDPEKKVQIKVSYGRRLRFEVKDQGEEFDFEGILKKGQEDIMRERGRGLCIVKQVMDVVRYEFQNGNLIIMEKVL